jgi:hypothetical protein
LAALPRYATIGLRREAMPKKEIVRVEMAASNPNLSLATRFGNLVFVAGHD